MCVCVCVGVALRHNPIHQGSNAPHIHTPFLLSLSPSALFVPVQACKTAKLPLLIACFTSCLPPPVHLPPPPPSSPVNRMYNMHTTLSLTLSLSFLHTSTTIWHPQKLLCVQCGVCLIFSTFAVFQLLFHSLKAIFKLRAHHTQLTINRHQRQKGAWLFACCCLLLMPRCLVEGFAEQSRQSWRR